MWDVVPGFLQTTLETEGWGKIERLPLSDVPREIVAQEPNLQFAPHYTLRKQNFQLLVAPKMLALSCHAPYPGWDRLFGEFQAVYAATGERIVERLARVGLRYIDFFPGSIFDNVKLSLALQGMNALPDRMTLHIPFQGRDGFELALRLTNGARRAPYPHESGSLLDVDTAAAPPADAHLDDLILSAHRQQKELFFALVEDDFLQTLNPEY